MELKSFDLSNGVHALHVPRPKRNAVSATVKARELRPFDLVNDLNALHSKKQKQKQKYCFCNGESVWSGNRLICRMGCMRYIQKEKKKKKNTVSAAVKVRGVETV